MNKAVKKSKPFRRKLTGYVPLTEPVHKTDKAFENLGKSKAQLRRPRKPKK